MDLKDKQRTPMHPLFRGFYCIRSSVLLTLSGALPLIFKALSHLIWFECELNSHSPECELNPHRLRSHYQNFEPNRNGVPHPLQPKQRFLPWLYRANILDASKHTLKSVQFFDLPCRCSRLYVEREFRQTTRDHLVSGLFFNSI